MNTTVQRPACATAGVDMYPDRDDETANAAAVAVCLQCPLRADCAATALDRVEIFGVWGALTEKRRESLRRHGKAPTGANMIRVAVRREEVARLAGQDVPISAIAERLGVTNDIVTADLRRLRGDHLPGQREARAAADAARAEEKAQRIDAMLQAGAAVKRIAQELHVHRRAVYRRRELLEVA